MNKKTVGIVAATVIALILIVVAVLPRIRYYIASIL